MTLPLLAKLPQASSDFANENPPKLPKSDYTPTVPQLGL